MTRFTVKCTSDFNAFNRFLNDDPILPLVLDQRAALGFNALRVWSCYEIPLIGRLNPSEWPNYFDQWPAFFELLAQYGLYAEVTAFTGIYPFWDKHQPQPMIDFWERLDTALDGVTNLLDLEAVNEGDNPPNQGVPLDRLRRPTNKLASHGSAVQDAPPMEPVWDVAGYRAPMNEWPRKVSHNPMADIADRWGIPAWTNEWPRTDNDPTIYHWEDGGAASALLCAGGCFHSPHGKDSTLFDGYERDCAEAFIRGSNSVPLEFQAGAYSRPEPNPPGILRIYRRTLGDGRYHEVRIRE